ncbi:hypothetical protein [Mucilaginibacter pedocola]|uniref:Uncharacterized protein n=1 Tax=Mucilaginibacter pedocola TaxID=1792845 RepID=A0A1S9PFE3_9SPHI|nr:hypothetical protein [Mucilaginibacter pedocola]OOQ59676.1 hypothetical protein BC343_05795 [Mucilaginibacter pedocola]
MIFDIIQLLIKGIIHLITPTQPSENYNMGLKQYGKAYFDEYYPFLFHKVTITDHPTDINWYQNAIGHITLIKRGSSKFFEIYESNIISDEELAMNVRLSYEDFVMTGLDSHKNSVVTQNQVFILFINHKMNRLEVRSSLDEHITDKMIKKDFGEYLFSHLAQQKKAGV